MHRRDFLLTSVAGAGFLACPGWIARAFGEESDETSRVNDLAAAAQRADRTGKPLLVFVIPLGDTKHERGAVLGEVINHGGPQALEDLLMCEIACATVPELMKVMPKVSVKGEPLMVLVEKGPKGLAPTVIDPQIQLEIPGRWDKRDEQEQAIRKRIGQVSEALHAALLPDKESLPERARRNREALGEEDRKALDELIAGKGEAGTELVARGAPVLRLAAEKSPDKATRGRLRKALADAATAEVRKKRPTGAKWAQSSGCGVEVEGEPDDRMMACGMGYVPELSQRFLWFYTK